MDNTRIEQTEKGVNQAKKAYRTPGKLMVLGAIDAVVLSGSTLGSDGSPGTESANS